MLWAERLRFGRTVRVEIEPWPETVGHDHIEIKAVLPVLVQNEEGSYQDLAIQEGATATETWNRIVTGQMSGGEIEAAEANLLAYCRLDTLAMVLIYEELKRAVEG